MRVRVCNLLYAARNATLRNVDIINCGKTIYYDVLFMDHKDILCIGSYLLKDAEWKLSAAAAERNTLRPNVSALLLFQAAMASAAAVAMVLLMMLLLPMMPTCVFRCCISVLLICSWRTRGCQPRNDPRDTDGQAPAFLYRALSIVDARF